MADRDRPGRAVPRRRRLPGAGLALPPGDDPRIKARVLKYLRCEDLTPHDRQLLGRHRPLHLPRRPALGDPAAGRADLGRRAGAAGPLRRSARGHLRPRRGGGEVPQGDGHALRPRQPAALGHRGDLVPRKLLRRAQEDCSPGRSRTGSRTTRGRSACRLRALATRSWPDRPRLKHLFETSGMPRTRRDRADRSRYPTRLVARLVGLCARDVLLECQAYRERCVEEGKMADYPSEGGRDEDRSSSRTTSSRSSSSSRPGTSSARAITAVSDGRGSRARRDPGPGDPRLLGRAGGRACVRGRAGRALHPGRVHGSDDGVERIWSGSATRRPREGAWAAGRGALAARGRAHRRGRPVHGLSDQPQGGHHPAPRTSWSRGGRQRRRRGLGLADDAGIRRFPEGTARPPPSAPGSGNAAALEPRIAAGDPGPGPAALRLGRTPAPNPAPRGGRVENRHGTFR